MSTLAPTMQAFFTERLVAQRRVSAHTVAAYRDTCRLLLCFAQERTGKTPSVLDIDDLDAPLIGAFLEHLETARGNTVRTRNARLAAVHSLFRFAALRHPEHAAVIQRVLAIPHKRFDHQLVSFLTRPEVEALLCAPDRSSWIGRRDHALLLVAVQTGLRVSELTGLTCTDVVLGAARTCTAWARTGRNAKRRSPSRRSQFFESGWPSDKGARTIRCSRAVVAGRSTGTPWNYWSPSMPQPPGNAVHP